MATIDSVWCTLCFQVTLILIAGVWCGVFPVCSMGSHVALLSFWEASGDLQAVFLLLQPLSSCQQLASCPFWVAVPIATPFAHRVHLFPSSSSWSSPMPPWASAQGHPYKAVWQGSECSWVELRTCAQLEGALCAYLCWGHWLGMSDRDKACYVWEFSREATCFLLYFAM